MTPKERSRAIREIKKAASKRQRADDARREATTDLQEWCRRAQAGGVPITEIASVAGLSRQGVYDLLGAKPSR